MGANDTAKLGLRRPYDGAIAWGDNDDESINHNASLLDEVLLPSDQNDDFQLRIVAKSFAGLAVPTGAKVFGSIQEAIDDVTVNNIYPDPIMVYPGIYYEELMIIDRAVHLFGAVPQTNVWGYGTVDLRSNQINGTATGRPCITIKMRTGKDSNAGAEKTPAELWTAHSRGIHPCRNGGHVIVSGFNMDNYGKYFTDEAHDEDTCYYLDCTDNGVPPYSGKATYITFHKCLFRGQTWKNRSYNGGGNDGPIVGWFNHGFKVRSYYTHLRFFDCGVVYPYYGGGTYGTEYLSTIHHPFYIGTDGTSFIGWARNSSGGDYFDGDVNGTQKGYYLNRATLRFMNSDFHASERHGNWDPYVGYVGNGWFYGHESDSSCAIVTLANMGELVMRGSTFYPSVWGSVNDYGPDPDDNTLDYANVRHFYVDPSDGASVLGEPRYVGNDTPGCYTDGFNTVSALQLAEPMLLNQYGNWLGGNMVRYLS